MNLVIVPGILVCISFLLSVCMFIVSKVLFANVECYSDCSRRVAIWLNPFATVLFNMCSAVTVERCDLFPCCVGVFPMVAVM